MVSHSIGNPSFDPRQETNSNLHDVHMLRSIYTLKQGLFVGTGQLGMNQRLNYTFKMGDRDNHSLNTGHHILIHDQVLHHLHSQC